MKKVLFALVAILLMGKEVQAQDIPCPPVTMPWGEPFTDGTDCWYIPNGSNWHDVQPNGYGPSVRHLVSTCYYGDSDDNWIMSPAIIIPNDVDVVRLSWKVSSSVDWFVHRYRVLITTDTNYTDTSNYQLLYVDEDTYANWSNYDTVSLDLSMYIGQTIHIAFNNRPTYHWNFASLIIDDVEIRGYNVNCPPVTLPWLETFVYGDGCWYLPNGSNWHDAIPYNDLQFEHLRHLYSNCSGNNTNNWIMSRAINIPDDTTVGVTLSWKVASSDYLYPINYQVLATASNNYTNPSSYNLLYTGNGPHRTFSHYDSVSVSLSQYAGQTIHIAFNNCPNFQNSYYNSYPAGLYIDDVYIRTTTVPKVNLTSNARTYNYNETAVFVASLVEGSRNGLTYTWHSTLLDTTIIGEDTLRLRYGMQNGWDSVSVIVGNQYGNDTAMLVIGIQTCYYRTLPFDEDFEGVPSTEWYLDGFIPSCWNSYWNSYSGFAPSVVNGWRSSSSNKALVMQAGTQIGATEASVILPIFVEPLQNLKLVLDYQYESSGKGSLKVGYGYFANSYFYSIKTLSPHANNYVSDTIIFSNVSNATARIMLRWTCNEQAWWGVGVDNIKVLTRHPIITVDGPASIFVNDSANITAQLMCGDIEELNYQWRSSLLDSTWSSDTLSETASCTLVYPRIGLDTITVIATNKYGVDSARLVIPVTTMYSVSAFSADTTMGTVTGSSNYLNNTVATLTALPNEGYCFLSWQDGDTINPRSFVVTQDTLFTAYFQEIEVPIGISEVKDDIIAIYPNPAGKRVTIVLNERLRHKSEVIIEFFDLQGHQVFTQVIKQPNNQEIILDVSDFQRGIYVVRIEGLADVSKLVLK